MASIPIAPDPTAAPPGWYPDPAELGMLRWWNGAGWTEHRRPADARAPEPPRPRRGALWWVWLGCSIGAFVVAVGLFLYGGVTLDHTSGHFGRIAVPGESYGLPDAGTYVISDGDYAAGMHETPDFVVTGPDGETVTVEALPSHRYGHEDNALALFHVPHPGRYRLQVNVEGRDLDRLPATITVDRSWDGTGDPLTAAWVSIAVGGFLLVVSFVFGVVFVVALVRRRPTSAPTPRVSVPTVHRW